MNALWNFFWPPFGAGVAIALVAGAIAFRRRGGRERALLAGFALAVAIAALWTGPLGAADRFVARVEHDARLTLDNYEMKQVTAHLHRAPLTRRLLLAGPADDFQSSELVRIMGSLPGVSSARWTKDGGGPPLILEAGAIAVLGFLFGLVLAYLRELRRRYNTQWNW
jgi:hypothetical protein